MKSLFNDSELQSQFDRLGFVKVQLFDAADVDALLSHYHAQRFNSSKSEAFFVSLDNAHPENARRVTKGIEQVLAPKMERFISDYQTFAGTFIVKEPGKKNIVPPHQDLTFVDETQHYSASIWTPLVDVSEGNGALGVIPGSHTIFNYPRAFPSPQYKAGLTDHVFTLFPYIEVIEMKAGESLIFNNRLIHASTPNNSNNARIAVGIGIAQKEVQLRHYYLSPVGGNKESIEVYEVDADFYNVYSNLDLRNLYLEGKSPDNLNKIETIKNHKDYDINKEDLVDKLSNLPNAKIDNSLMERIGISPSHDVISAERKEKDALEGTNNRDTRTFRQKFSPGNILREVVWRMKGKPNAN